MGVARPPLLRFWKKVRVDEDSGCWVWIGNRLGGYGNFYTKGKARMPAHRFAYETLVGSIPEGLQLDHLCRNRPCVNPRHLDPVTLQENVRRAARALTTLTPCRNGHLDTFRSADGKRRCPECSRAAVRRHRAKIRADAA